MAERFQILSLSGGGFLGLYTVTILAELENETGQPLARSFDLISGTSVGGIIALALAAEVPAIEIKNAFEKNGRKIFSCRPVPTGRWSGYRDLARFAFKPKYDGKYLKKTVEQIVGEQTLIRHLRHRVLVPAVNVTKGQVQIFKTPHHASFSRDLRLRVADVAMATSAAPTYFPLAEIEDSLFVDGGLYANSPDLLALHEAQHFLKIDIADIHLLSIGTTTARYSFAHEEGKEFGAVDWLTEQRLTSVMLAAQQQSVDFISSHRLQERYLRLDHEQSKTQERHLALDVATEAAQKTIRGVAMSTVQTAMGSGRLAPFLAHRAAAPIFYNL